MTPAHLPPPADQKTWSVGTLTYTTAGLALLFTWLLFGDFAYMLRERSAVPVTQLMLKKHQASDFFTGIFLLTIPQAIIFSWVRSLVIGAIVTGVPRDDVCLFFYGPRLL